MDEQEHLLSADDLIWHKFAAEKEEWDRKVRMGALYIGGGVVAFALGLWIGNSDFTWEQRTPLPETHVYQSEVIEEDDPRWDCTTMGNRICGDN